MRLLLALILSLTFLHATTLYGDIINAEDFENLNNTIIKIQGPISMQFVANGNYSVVLTPGSYTLLAYHYQQGALKYYSKDDIAISGEETRFDLVLLPSEFQNVYDLEVGDEGLPVEEELTDITPFLFAIALVIIVVAYLFYRSKKPPKEKIVEKPAEEKKAVKEEMEEHELDEDQKKILKILKEQEGRMMQRELREILNFSETKMSLIMAELEAMELIKRIKRGRENIVKLKK